jgi:hypothetical protein
VPRLAGRGESELRGLERNEAETKVPRYSTARANGQETGADMDSINPDNFLSGEDTKAGRLQRACLKLLLEHKRNGDIPTNGRFLFYELEQHGVIPKKYDGVNPKTGKPLARTPLQDVSVATMHLRECGLIPWHWIEDETRTLTSWRYADSVAEYVVDTVPLARIDVWAGEQPPLIICESRATMGVLRDLAYQYLVPITATNGQSGGFIVTDIVPLLTGNRRVLYIGDFELRGPADQIEGNTKRYIEEHTGRTFGKDEWTKIALTEKQVNASPRLERLSITKLDKRYKPAKEYEAIECEALGQGVLNPTAPRPPAAGATRRRSRTRAEATGKGSRRACQDGEKGSAVMTTPTIVSDQTFGHWRVLRIAHRRALCRCRCGRVHEVSVAALEDGSSVSCGCSRPPRQATVKRFQHPGWRPERGR